MNAPPLFIRSRGQRQMLFVGAMVWLWCWLGVALLHPSIHADPAHDSHVPCLVCHVGTSPATTAAIPRATTRVTPIWTVVDYATRVLIPRSSTPSRAHAPRGPPLFPLI